MLPVYDTFTVAGNIVHGDHQYAKLPVSPCLIIGSKSDAEVLSYLSIDGSIHGVQWLICRSREFYSRCKDARRDRARNDSSIAEIALKNEGSSNEEER